MKDQAELHRLWARWEQEDAERWTQRERDSQEWQRTYARERDPVAHFYRWLGSRS